MAMREVCVTASQLLRASDALDEMTAQDLKFPLDVAYRLLIMRRSVSEAEEYVMERMGRIVDIGGELTDEEKVIADAVMSTQIRLEIPSVKVSEVTNNKEAEASIGAVDALLPLLKGK